MRCSLDLRAAEQILAPEAKPEQRRPPVLSKRTWARVEADQGTVVEQGLLEALRRDLAQQRRWVVLTDGQADRLRQVDAAPQALPGGGYRGAGLRACARIPGEGRLCAAS